MHPVNADASSCLEVRAGPLNLRLTDFDALPSSQSTVDAYVAVKNSEGRLSLEKAVLLQSGGCALARSSRAKDRVRPIWLNATWAHAAGPGHEEFREVVVAVACE